MDHTRLTIRRLSGRLLLAAPFVCLALIPLAKSPTTHALPSALPVGTWETYANGDDVLNLQLQGSILWAGTRAGGLVRWDTVSRTYVQYLRPQDPLAGNTIYDVAIAPDGSKWLATDGGLTVFDDKGTLQRGDDSWHTYTYENTFHGLASDAVRAVAFVGPFVYVGTYQIWDPLNEVWWGGGLSRLDTKGTAVTTDDTWAPIMTFASTFKRNPDGTFQLGLVSDNINDIVVTPKGNLWIAASKHYKLEKIEGEDVFRWQRVFGGLSYVDLKGTADPADDKVTSPNCEDSSATVPTLVCDIKTLALDASGFVWATLRGKGVMYFRADEPQISDDPSRIFKSPDHDEGVLGDTMVSIAFGPQDNPALKNTVWIGRTNGGFSVVDHKGTLSNHEDDEWNFGRDASFTTADGLAVNRVQAIAIGGGSAWIGTGTFFGTPGGIGQLSLADLNFKPGTNLNTKGLPTNFITDMDFGKPATKWAGHAWITTGSRTQRRFGDGVVDLDTKGDRNAANDNWTQYTTLTTDADGKLPWTGLAGDNVQSVAVQSDTVWFGSTESSWDGTKWTDGGLTVFDGGTWTARTKPASGPGLRDNSVSALELGCDGEIWIGTGSPIDYNGAGVDVLKPGASVHRSDLDTWKTYSYVKHDELSSRNVTGMAVDCAGGQRWVVGTHHINDKNEQEGGGAALLKVAGPITWTQYTASNGLETFKENNILAEALSVLAGPNGTAWVGTYGTRNMTVKNLIDAKPHWPAVLNHWDGTAWTASIFPLAGWVSSIARDKDGRLWVGTSRGGTARESATPETWRDDRYEGGLMVSDGSKWITETVSSHGIPSNDISVVVVAPDGDIWIGTEGWGIARFEVGAIPPTATPTVNPSDAPTATPTAPATSTQEATPTPVLPTASATQTQPPPSPTPEGGTPRPRIYIPYVFQVRLRTGPAPTRTPRSNATATRTATRAATPRPQGTPSATPIPQFTATRPAGGTQTTLPPNDGHTIYSPFINQVRANRPAPTPTRPARTRTPTRPPATRAATATP